MNNKGWVCLVDDFLFSRAAWLEFHSPELDTSDEEFLIMTLSVCQGWVIVMGDGAEYWLTFFLLIFGA